jgi:hypothetical protein
MPASQGPELSVSFTTLTALDPTLLSQLKEALPASLFDKGESARVDTYRARLFPANTLAPAGAV